MGHRILILCILTQAGCVRWMSATEDGGSDGGQLDVAHSDVSPDAAADAQPASLNESCVARPCRPGLVCTGAGETRYCRPVCDGGGCAEGQACGRPIVGGETDPEAPRACITSASADKYESCQELPCKKGLACIKGDLGAVCFPLCLSQTNCDATQFCLPATSGPGICTPKCDASTPCPPTLKCIGMGPYPTDTCAPVTPVGLYAVCDATHVCGSGMRCFGQPNQTQHCYKICPAPSLCATNELCIAVDQTTGAAACLTQCGLFDSPSPCQAHEVCAANGALAKTHCVPGPGELTDCSTRPCVTGKICVDKVCKTPCDSSHPCPGIVSCKQVSYNGQPMPWSACN